MVGDLPSDFGESSTNRPPAEGWTPASPAQPSSRSQTWPAIALAAIALVVAVIALVVALLRSAPASPPRTATASAPTAAEAAAAQQQLCDTYKLAARAVQLDTNGNNAALARIADTNGAVMLNMAAANPALDAAHRDAARALATAYLMVTAKGNTDIASDAEFRAAIDDVVAKDAAMKQVCGGG